MKLTYKLEMLRNGICRSSRIALEQSTNSKSLKRMVAQDLSLDYRALNSLTKKDAYPIPNPRDIIDRL